MTKKPTSQSSSESKDEVLTSPFTYTRLSSFLTCERLEWFAFQAGGCGVERIKKETFWLEGEFGHYALKHWYTNAERGGLMLRANMVKRIEKMIEDLGEMELEEKQKIEVKLAAMVGACHAYKQQYKSDFARYKVLFVEEPFEITIGDIPFMGRLDLGIQDKETKEIGFMEHKFLTQFSLNNWTVLPLNLQQLIYTLGFKEITGKYPNWYMWNIIQKSKLRRKGMTPMKGHKIAQPEPILEFEARVQQQYLQEPDKMFFRPPPRLVEEKPLEKIQDHIIQHVKAWREMQKAKDLPPMRFPSCETKYGGTCPFAEACAEELLGHKQGWNAPKNRGLYRLKEVLHPELEEDGEE